MQSAFAQLRQSQPAVAPLYRDNHLWEDMPADLAAAELRRRLATTVERQRDRRPRAAGRPQRPASVRRCGGCSRSARCCGSRIVQPVLEAFLTTGIERTPRQLAGLIVGILSGTALLKNVSFLALWFLVIWLALRWNTQRRVNRLLTRWKSADYPDRALNLTTQALEWMSELVEPVRRHRERVESLIKRAQQFRPARPFRRQIAASACRCLPGCPP